MSESGERVSRKLRGSCARTYGDRNYRWPMGRRIGHARGAGRPPERLMSEPRANIPTLLLVPSWWCLRPAAENRRMERQRERERDASFATGRFSTSVSLTGRDHHVHVRRHGSVRCVETASFIRHWFTLEALDLCVQTFRASSRTPRVRQVKFIR